MIQKAKQNEERQAKARAKTSSRPDRRLRGLECMKCVTGAKFARPTKAISLAPSAGKACGGTIKARSAGRSVGRSIKARSPGKLNGVTSKAKKAGKFVGGTLKARSAGKLSGVTIKAKKAGKLSGGPFTTIK
jgi:hypothetical protein